MDIYLIRHGKTAGNQRKAYIGITDEPVLEDAMEDLRGMSPYHHVEKVYITPLQRTKMTADVFFPAAEKVVVPELREMDFGIFEGKNFEDLAENEEYRNWVEGNCLGKCPHGDSIIDFAKTVCTKFLALVRQGIVEGRDEMTFVIHGGVIMSLAYELCTEKRDFYEWWTDNGKCRHFRLNPTIWSETHKMDLIEE